MIWPPFSGNIDWEKGILNTVGNAPTVNIEGFDRLTSGWQDIWAGGSQRADLSVDGAYLKVAHDFGQATLTSISSYDRTHALYEEDNTGDGNVIGGVNHDVLIIDMDQSYHQFSQELRLASNDDAARFRWITGLYYLGENGDARRRTSASATTAFRALIPRRSASPRRVSLTSFPIRMATRSLSASIT